MLVVMEWKLHFQKTARFLVQIQAFWSLHATQFGNKCSFQTVECFASLAFKGCISSASPVSPEKSPVRGAAKPGAPQGRGWAPEKAAAEAQARLDKGLCVSCGASGHQFSACPKGVSGAAQHRGLQEQDENGNGGKGGNPQPPRAKPKSAAGPSEG